MSRFEINCRADDLNEAIASFRAALALIPSDLDARPTVLMNLGSSLLTRFKHFSRIEDLNESISLHYSSVALRSDDSGRSSSLSNLGNSLIARFRQDGNTEDLNEAISIYRSALDSCPDGHVDRPSILMNLGCHLGSRFKQNGNVSDLDESIELHRAALALRPNGHPRNLPAQCNLASSLITRFDRCSKREDLDEAIDLLRDALNHCPEKHAVRSFLLMNLGVSLSSRYRYSGSLEVLDESIAVYCAALAVQPVQHPNRALILSNLGNALQSRSLHNGNAEDRDDSITYHRAALSLRPDGHPDRYVSQNNLGDVLRSRFLHGMKMEDLEESISLHRAALESCPINHSDRFGMMSNLGDCLNHRFVYTGRIEDLDESIALYRASVSLCPEGHVLRCFLQDNLGDALRLRAERGGPIESIDEAIALHRTALTSFAETHPHRVFALSYLGNALRVRFSHHHRTEDIDEAVASYREASELLTVKHPNYSASLANLGSSLRIRFEHFGRAEDISESISLHRASVELRPHGRPDRSSALHGLADALYSRFENQGSKEDLEVTIELLERSACHTFSSLLRRLKAAQKWAVVARSHDHRTTADAYGSVMSLLQRALTVRPTLSSRHDLLASSDHFQSIALDAASYYIEKGNLTRAIEVLDQGRALLWSGMRGIRTPINQLARVDETLATKFRDCSRRLNAIMTSPESRPNPPIMIESGANAQSVVPEQRSVDEMFAEMRKLSEEQEGSIEEIRRIPGFEDFLQAARFGTLKQAASEGPVVVINHSKFRCDALIVLDREDEPCICVPLDGDWFAEGNEICNTLLQSRKEPGVDSVEYDEALRRVMKALWDRLVSKVIQKLTELGIPRGSRIWWCPTSILTMLPFHAAGPYRRADGQIRYLLDDYISSYTPTLKSLINARKGVQNRNGEERLLIVADTKLHSAQKERDSVRRYRRINKQLLGDRASLSSVRRALHRAEWVHFVCHGILDEKQPFNSSLKLSDGNLTLLDIVRANIPNAEFAYLSACHTAEQGSNFALDETLHLAAAMQFCGFRSVVGTMWKLLDRDGPFLAGAVYAHLMLAGDVTEGEVKFKRAAAGVREAAIRLRDKRDEGPDGTEVDTMTERWVNLVHIGA